MKKSLIGAVVGMLVLGACGTPAYLAADVTFTQDMIPHHEQALDMAKLVPSRSTNEKVRGLAERIEKAQDPEITQMKNADRGVGRPEHGPRRPSTWPG